MSDQREWEWSCGHVAGAMCAECYHLLAFNAGAIARDRDDLRAQLAEAAAFLDLMAKRIDRIRQGRSIDSGMRAAADCRAMAAKLRGHEQEVMQDKP